MKEIPLTQGQVALVDDDNYNWLNKWKWFAQEDKGNYYAGRNLPLGNGKRKGIKMHRLIMGFPGKFEIDHKDGNTTNNQRYNLRLCTHRQNTKNKKKVKKATSLYKGVHWNKRDRAWVAFLGCDGKNISLGYYQREIAAAIAYDLGATHFFGKFANVNFKSGQTHEK